VTIKWKADISKMNNKNTVKEKYKKFIEDEKKYRAMIAEEDR